MEDILKSKLKDDETLLWCAVPESFETLDKTHKAHFMRKAILVAIGMVAVILLYILAADKNHAAVQPLVIAVLLAAGAYGIFGDILDANKLRKRLFTASPTSASLPSWV